MKKCIILANGKAPLKSTINFLIKKNYSTLICADGGANSALKLNLKPDYIIGDLDSLSKSAFDTFKNTSQIKKIKRQNDTDVEKCLKFALSRKFEKAVLLGVTGGRLDHTICNLGILIKFFDKIKLKIISEDSLLVPYSGSIELNTIPGETISLYGFDKKTKIKSKGLKYPLKNIMLPFGEKESTSNIAESKKVVLKIKGGVIFLIRDFNIIRKYDLL